MSDTTGICYTWSGNKKKYESDLFSAQLNVFSHEYCHRYDSGNTHTLVFGKSPEESDTTDQYIDKFNTYLPYGGVSINHNIQDNGEDHYSLSGTYTKPKNWSPPAGLDGPFNSSIDLKYPYYVYVIGWTKYVSTQYNGEIHILDDDNGIQDIYYYGNKRITPPADDYPTIYVVLDISLNPTGSISCECESVPDWLIPGTNNGNDRMGVRVQLTDGVDSSNDEVFYFSWIMKDGINETRSCRPIWPYYCSSAYFTTKSDGWVEEHSDGHKSYWRFSITNTIPSPPSS